MEPTEFSVSNTVSRTTITWDAIVHAAETADFILLFQSNQMAQFLSISAGAALDAIAARIKARLGEEYLRQIAPRANPNSIQAARPPSS